MCLCGDIMEEDVTGHIKVSVTECLDCQVACECSLFHVITIPRFGLPHSGGKMGKVWKKVCSVFLVLKMLEFKVCSLEKMFISSGNLKTSDLLKIILLDVFIAGKGIETSITFVFPNIEHT